MLDVPVPEPQLQAEHARFAKLLNASPLKWGVFSTAPEVKALVAYITDEVVERSGVYKNLPSAMGRGRVETPGDSRQRA
jgi:hypothetical protein